jgi:hypothetical protein
LITQTLIGKRVSKRFSAGIYLGTVTSTWNDYNHDQYWTVRYDDEDQEDLNLNEIREALSLYKLYPHEYRFDGTIPDTSDKRGADLLTDRGANVSTDRGADVPTERGATKRGAKQGADIPNKKQVDTSDRRCSARLKRGKKDYQKNASRLWQNLGLSCLRHQLLSDRM